MSWYFRAVQGMDGSWVCQFGSQEFGTLPDLALALHHMAEAATQLGGRELFTFQLYYADGTSETRPATDPLPAELAEQEVMDTPCGPSGSSRRR